MTLFTLIHVAISLIAILAGIGVVYGLINGKNNKNLTLTFLILTAATSLSGFGFIRHHVMPAHIVGVIALLVLAVTVAALYVFRLGGLWRKVYVVGAVASLYLNVFVLIVQLYLKVPALHALAPTQHEFPFKLTQGWILILFVLTGALAVIRFKPAGKRGK